MDKYFYSFREMISLRGLTDSRSAAELAYFLILTFFPVLICINAFIGLLHLDINAVLAAARRMPLCA